MSRTIRTLAVALAIATATLLGSAAHGAVLEGRVAELEPFLGTWEVEGEWRSGQTLWSRSTFSAGFNGKFVESRVLVRDGDAPPYQRYLSVFRYDDTRGVWLAHKFDVSGAATVSEFSFEGGVLTVEWTEGETVFRDRSELIDDTHLRWTVSVQPKGTDEASVVMDTTWRKVTAEMMRQPIDPNLFAADDDLTSFVVEADIAAPVSTVYRAWTDGEFFARSYAPDRSELKANIDLAIGGRYEWLFDGVTGGNGCQVLSYIPDRMVSFSWNAPPEQPQSRAQRTWVVVEFEDHSATTHVRLTHLGFGQAPHWQETKEYFQKAWPYVLEQFRKNLGD